MSAVTVFCQGWRFQVDREKTKAFRGELRTEISRFPAELQACFERLGIDPACPAGIGDAGDLWYLLSGTAESEDGLELDFYGPDQFVSVVVDPRPQGWQEDGRKIQGPCVLLEVFGA